MRRQGSPLSFVLLILVGAGPLVLLLYVFYGMEVRLGCEDLLFDLRTRLKPQNADTSRIAVVTIGQTDIAVMEGEGVAQPSLANLRRLVLTLLDSQPEAVALLIPHQDIDYNSQDFADFLNLLRDHKNVYFGTFDCNYNQPTDALIPQVLLQYPNQVFGADTLRKYRKEVIRYVPAMAFRGLQLEPQLSTALALRYATPANKQVLQSMLFEQIHSYLHHAERFATIWNPFPLPAIHINYSLPHTFLSVRARELWRHGPEARLKGRMVLLGYTAFRKRDFVFREGTHVNTPWEGGLNPEIFGFPMVYLVAAKLQNLLGNSWLRPGNVLLVVGQTIICGAVSFLVWRLAPFIAVILLLGFFCTLVYVHALMFSYLNLAIPLADTLFFSVLAMIAGAFRRAHLDANIRAYKELKAKSQKTLALIQGRFLNRFSFELYELNVGVAKLLSKHSGKFGGGSPLGRVLDKTLSSSEELRDYLAGIKQYARLAENDNYQVRKGPVAVPPLLRRVVNQLEAQITAAKLKVSIDCNEDVAAWTDELLLEPIVFNLVSNAVKYSPQAGEVAIRVSVWENGLVLSVLDQGPGIAEEYTEKIFEKFYRVKNDQVYQIKGNGLGLYLCQYFAKKIGANIQLNSQLGVGSEFRLMIEQWKG